MVGVDDFGGGEDDCDLALPRQGLAAGRTDMAGPSTVIDFSQRSQGLGAGLSVHREHGAKVLQGDDAETADLPKQPTACPLVLLLLGCARQQSGRRYAVGVY